MANERVQALGFLESLKLGVVDGAARDLLSVGTSNAAFIDELDDDLIQASDDSDRGSFRLLVGPYGAGKTHHLEISEAQALSEGFVVARAVFDAVEVSPDRSNALYAKLASSLRYPDDMGIGRQGLGPLLDRAVESPEVFERWTGRRELWERRPRTPALHAFLGPALFQWQLTRASQDEEAAERVLSWIEGRPVAMGSLRLALRETAAVLNLPFSVLGRYGYDPLAFLAWRAAVQIGAYLLGGLASLAAEVGFKGLVVLIDEAEFVEAIPQRFRVHAERVVRSLLVAALPDASEERLPHGGYRRHARIPYRFQPRQPIAVLAAMTPEEAEPACVIQAGRHPLRHWIDAAGGKTSALAPLSGEEMSEIITRVLRVARQAGLPGAHTRGLQESIDAVIADDAARGLRPSPRQIVRLTASLVELPCPGGALTPDTLRSWQGR
jgi:hypothetical protein